MVRVDRNHRSWIFDFGFWIAKKAQLSSKSEVQEPTSVDAMGLHDRIAFALHQPDAPARGMPSDPCWRVGLVSPRCGRGVTNPLDNRSKGRLTSRGEGVNANPKIHGPFSIDDKARLNKIQNPRSKIQNPRFALFLLAISAAGCQSFSSPLAQWRAAYDSNLYKKMTPEEMADSAGPGDSANLLQRWLKPSQNPSESNRTFDPLLDAGPRVRRLAADRQAGPGPEGRRGIPGRTQTFQARKVRRSREGVRQDRQGPQGEHVGRERTVLPGRVPVPAEALCLGQRQLREAPRRLSRDRISPEADRPRVRVRTTLARPDRSQGARRQEAALDVSFRRPAALR